MLFIFDASGNPLKVVPEKVYQGSNKANTIYFAMPMSAQINYEVNVQYRLPTGNVLPMAHMVSQGKIEGVTLGDMPVYVWASDLTANETSFVGQVTIQFFVQFGEEIIATAAGEFTVDKGVPVKLPTPTAGQQITYNQIIATLSSIENILIDTASSSGFKFTVFGDNHEVYVSGYNGNPENDTKYGKLRIAPYKIINGEYYKVVGYSHSNGTAAIVNYGNIEFPDTLYGIGAKAFNNVAMSDVPLVIPKSVEYIGDNAFNFKTTSSVGEQKIVFESPAFPWEIENQAFGTNSGFIKIYCTTSAYPDWKNYVDTNYKSGRVIVISEVDTDILQSTLENYQKKIDNSLNTTAKNIVGAINENKAGINSNTTSINRNAQAISANTKAINANKASIETEETNRKSADSSLSNSISNVESSLSSETTNRKAADTNLQNQINAANTEIDKKLDKTGGSISGNLAITGDLTVTGTTKTENVEQLSIDEPVIIVNGKKVDLQTVLAGIAINKNANATYGIMYDPATDTVLFGEGTVDANEHFTFSTGEGNPLAIRADSSAFTDVHLVKWNAAKNMFEDAGVTSADIVTTCNSYTDSKVSEALGTVETALAAIDTGAGV